MAIANMATISIELPDGIIRELEAAPGGISRAVLEAVAVEGYRAKRLSRAEVRRLLDLSWHETEAFLAQHGAQYHYAAEDLENDQRTLDRVLGRP
jgi:predicted HTH domain antitoxin